MEDLVVVEVTQITLEELEIHLPYLHHRETLEETHLPMEVAVAVVPVILEIMHLVIVEVMAVLVQAHLFQEVLYLILEAVAAVHTIPQLALE
tara:strand:- start:216 stop:491 length:276 start_codon:yes stop_codon:yes gene_type:complete